MSDDAAGADPADGAPGYPGHWEADVLASDGRIVHLRPIRPSDADALVRMHDSLSDRTRYLRYFGPHPKLSGVELERFTNVDHQRRVALICTVGDEIIAVGRYEGATAATGPWGSLGNSDPSVAEVAFVTRDDHQGRGLGSILLEHLAAAARENGLRGFEAEVLAENRGMVHVFRQAGYQISRAFEDGVVHLEFDIDPTEQSMAVRDAREQRAEARSVHNLLHPRSVAVIGASGDPLTVGYAVFSNLLRSDFAGTVYPVNPQARSVRGVRCYGSVTEIPDEVDLAVVAVPPDDIDAVMDSCLEKGVAGLVVLSRLADGNPDGSSNGSPDGSAAQRRLVNEARAHGMRVVGPNALGIANTDRRTRLNATLAPEIPERGRIGFFAQSGALGISLLAEAKQRGLGLSTFVSAGSRADVSGNDLLQYWQTDPSTDLVLLYLETFGNPRKFGKLASRLARTKPVVAVKSGRHLGQMGRSDRGPTDEAAVRQLFEQAGVIRVDNLTQLFDTALLLSHQPLPRGPRIAVVGNSTALGTLATDALLDEGLEPAGAPVDIGAVASPEQLAAGIRAAIAGTTDGPPPDGLIVVFVPPVAVQPADYARALREAVAGADLPVAAVFLAVEGIPDGLAVVGPDQSPGRGSVPSYPSPERAVAAMARVSRYARWLDRPIGEYARPDGVDSDRARRLVAKFGAEHRHTLTDHDAIDLLACYGIPVTEYRVTGSADDALAAAQELGFPVAVKAVGDQWHNRPDQIGVRLDILTETGIRTAYEELTQLSGRPEVLVQRMAPKGVSVVLEVIDDPSFGSLLSFGLAGMATELLGDLAFRAVPLSDVDAAELIREPRAAPLLTGYRGNAPVRLDALADLVRRVGQMAEDVPELRSLRLAPVLASPEGVFATGAKIELGPAPTRQETGPRRLRSAD